MQHAVNRSEVLKPVVPKVAQQRGR